jgi:hypothetical protein
MGGGVRLYERFDCGGGGVGVCVCLYFFLGYKYTRFIYITGLVYRLMVIHA